jgi:hypothetical protein
MRDARARLLATLLLWAGIILCPWVLGGCQQRDPVPPAARESGQGGADIFCTRAFFYGRFPAVERQDHSRYRAYADEPMGIATNPRASESLHWRLTYGLYDPQTHTCWSIARDPGHPSREERTWMQHEHCHRVEDLYGWDAAAPLWNALPSHLHTHPEIEVRLRAWRRQHAS